MFEFFVAFALFTSIIFILDVPLATYAVLLLCGMEFVLLASILFFIISFILYLFAKPEKGKFAGFGVKFDNKISFAYYEINGEQYSNFYPTDGYSKKKFYKKEEENLRVLRIKNLVLVFDKVFLLTVFLGTITFTMSAGVVSLFIYWCFTFN